MWLEPSVQEWDSSTSDKKLSIYYNSAYLSAVASVYKLRLVRYLYKNKANECIGLFAVFINAANRVVVPDGFTFSAFWIDQALSEQTYFKVVEQAIELLKKDCRRVFFKLECDFKDIRPFIWKQFTIEPKFTHIKDTYTPIGDSVAKNLRKAHVANYRFVCEDFNETGWILNKNLLKSLGGSARQEQCYEALLRAWQGLNLLKCFSVYKEDVLLSSNFALVDVDQQKLYTILLNNVSNADRYAHTFSYQQIIEWAKDNGFTNIDFCGANLEGISIFKSSFNTKLTLYYKVTYSPFKSTFNGVLETGRIKLARFRNYLFSFVR